MQAFFDPLPRQCTHSSIKCVTDEAVGRLVSDNISIEFDYRTNLITSQEPFTYEVHVCQSLYHTSVLSTYGCVIVIKF